MPNVSATVLAKLGAEPIQTYAGELEWQPGRLTGNPLGERTILFPKLERAE